MTKKILMVLTSHDELGDTGKKTGFWLEEFAAPYYVFKDAGVDVTLASPKGGQPPIDPMSAQEENQTKATKRFNDDSESQAVLAHTERLAKIDASDYDAVFYPGGHGPLWDLVSDKDSIRLIESFWKQDKPVAAVCHAPAALINAKDASGDYIVAGRAVTGFTNSEEEAVQLKDVVPLLVQDSLSKRGGEFESTDDWGVLVRHDGNLITGQNPASSAPAARELLEALK